MNLYNITKNLTQLNQMIEDGVDPEQLEEAFNDVEEAFEDKAKSVLFVLKNMQANIDSVKSEEDRLKKKRAMIERQYSGLKEYLMLNMVELGLGKIDNGVLKASLTKPKPMLVVTQEGIVSDLYKREKTTVSIDKKKMLDDLKDGKKVAGAEIGESKAGLNLK